MISTGQGQFRVDHAGLDTKLFQEEFDTVTPLDVVDKDDGFPSDELELEQNVDEQEFVAFRGESVVLDKEG